MICYELGSGIGGAFKYFDKEDPGAKAYDSTLLTVSNYFMGKPASKLARAEN